MYANDPSPFSATVPWLGPVTSTAVSGLLPGSLSLARTPSVVSTVSGVSSSVGAATFWATGGSLTEATVIDTVAVLESALPSLAVKVKRSGPL